jgi:pimeloyl-ACP methyl ester carboxylesterase
MIGEATSHAAHATPASEEAMPQFLSDGVSISYLDEGAGEPILMIHGFASNARVNWVDTGWVRFVTAAGYRAIGIDNRGHGASEKLYDTAAYPAPIMAEDARRLLEHLGIASAHVMGYSMGARITAFLTMAHPERVKTAVFAGLGINMVRGVAGTGPIAHALEAASVDEVTHPTARTFRVFAEQTKSDLKALAACIRSSRDPITAEALGRVARPVLVAVGDQDVIGGSAVELAALIPGAEALVLEGKDHMKAVGDRAFKEGAMAFWKRHA